MPNPASSGTGFLDVSAWLQTFGEESRAGGTWMICTEHRPVCSLGSNRASWRPRVSSIGISFEYPAVQLKRQGAPLDIILPKEGLGWDIEATAVIKGHRPRGRGTNSPTSPQVRGDAGAVQGKLRGTGSMVLPSAARCQLKL